MSNETINGLYKSFLPPCKKDERYDGVLLWLPELKQFCAIYFGTYSDLSYSQSDGKHYLISKIFKFDEINLQFKELYDMSMKITSPKVDYDNDITNALLDGLTVGVLCKPRIQFVKYFNR